MLSAAPADGSEPDARAWHYGVFYGLRPLGSDDPVALVWGNCQAESLRCVLDGGGLATVQMPPVHELVASDLPHVERWLGRAQTLVSQPVRDFYRGLPLGTNQLAARLGEGAGVVRVPVIRFAGLYPTHAIIRPPSDPGLAPPVVEYHDLRVLTEAAARRSGLTVADTPLGTEAVLAIAALSLVALRTREAAHDTVVVSDLFDAPSFELMRTLNHPGNPIWMELAARVRQWLGLPGHGLDPGRPLLSAVHAPWAAAVIEAFGLDAEPRDDWIVHGANVEAGQVREAHLRWYEQHPDAVDAGLARHADALRLLGLA